MYHPQFHGFTVMGVINNPTILIHCACNVGTCKWNFEFAGRTRAIVLLSETETRKTSSNTRRREMDLIKFSAAIFDRRNCNFPAVLISQCESRNGLTTLNYPIPLDYRKRSEKTKSNIKFS